MFELVIIVENCVVCVDDDEFERIIVDVDGFWEFDGWIFDSRDDVEDAAFEVIVDNVEDAAFDVIVDDVEDNDDKVADVDERGIFVVVVVVVLDDATDVVVEVSIFLANNS